MAAKGRRLLKSQVVRMIATAKQTLADTRAAELEGYRLRQYDPMERAKQALRRAGYAVFAHSVVQPGSPLIVVGTVPRKPVEVIDLARMHGRW